MKKILILGGTGYIGSHLYSVLYNTWDRSVCSVDLEWFGNVMGFQSTKTDFRKLREDDLSVYDCVILVAAHSSVPMCNADPRGAFQNNVVNFVDLVNKLKPHQKFIYAGSSCVYVETGNWEANETYQLRPVDSLSYTKTCIDQYMTTFNPCEYYGLRFGSVNGWSPNFRPDLMINAMTLNSLEKGELSVSNGHCHRPILGMRDLGRAVQAVVECKEDRRGIYNVSSFNAPISVVADGVGKALGAKVTAVDAPPTYDFSIDTSKFCQTFDFKFEETLESIVNSIVENKPHIFDLKNNKRVRNRKYV